MIGGVYSSERCPACGNSFRDDGKKGLFCPEHPQYQATKFFVRFKGGIFKRFNNYESANRFLIGLRFRLDEDSFDPRDYRKEKPLGFLNLTMQWLEIKRNEVKASSFNKIQNHISRAVAEWGQRNIKDIGYAEIEDFIQKQKLKAKNQPVSSKTKANIKSTLHSFWVWLLKRRILTLAKMPEFPEVDFELSWRQVIDKQTQQSIIGEVYKISHKINIKIWLGIKWLATYIAIRPGELMNIKEGDFDLNLGVVVIRQSKEKKAKTIPLLPEDLDLLRQLPRGLPDLYFFRHVSGTSGAKAGQRFGDKYLYKWWKRACENLGIEGVDLYGGTRHSSARALREFRSPEEIKRATMHSTNKAFERYFQIELEDVREIYGDARAAAPKLHHGAEQKEKDNILKLIE